ncbi:alpha/beta-hydrolase [Viridothelium virens]|uniref:Alpha/beta-hydrolase n=1 Tax=Viridothelium virens TaxID=1048519 RepID=A0A6A6HBT5_VIRVR|nr:alpha/beta-hydrolase [Viridothelium virens]
MQSDNYSLETLQIATSSGPLELLACLPHQPKQQRPLLFLHGAHCAAACFKILLPLMARAGYASYALSLRGHGKSWQPSTFAFHVLTSIDSYVADAQAGLDFLTAEYPDTPAVVVGHSMGGGVWQRALSLRPDAPVAGLVLLASAPLSGGGLDVARNWQAAQAQARKSEEQPSTGPPASTDQGWLPWLLSFVPSLKLDTGIETPAQVRSKFFSAGASDKVVEGWMRDSKGRLESVRVSIESFWPLADAGAVLAGITSMPSGRKVLCVSAEKDALVSSEVSRQNFEAYRSICQGEEEVLQAELSASAHHVMLDVARERCATLIINWLEGRSV